LRLARFTFQYLAEVPETHTVKVRPTAIRLSVTCNRVERRKDKERSDNDAGEKYERAFDHVL
jgi:hypothetical protein